MAICQVCSEDVPGRGGLFRHLRDEHPVEAAAIGKLARAKSLESRQKSGDNGSTPPGEPAKRQALSAVGTKPAASIGDASIIAIAPRRFEMTSILLWQAREAAIREWGWNANISPEDFLDTYLFESFKQRGILLGGYQVLSKERNDGHS